MTFRFLLMGIVAVYLAACGTSSLPEGATASDSLGSALGGETAAVQTGAVNVSDAEARRKLREVAQRAADANTAGDNAYQLGPQDVIEIAVFKVPELSKTVQISEAGTINYPLIGETKVAGRTARGLEQELTQQLAAKYLQNPQVTVLVREHNSKRVTIEGAVKKPGIYPLQGGMTLVQLIATAQGLDEVAEDEAVILRVADGNRQAARFSLSELRDGGGQDPQLKAGDVVIVNTSATKQAFNNVIKVLPVARFFMLF
jgi:polysaccharide export outer membrane protein